MSNPDTAIKDLPDLPRDAGPPEEGVIRLVAEHVDYANRFVTVNFDDVVFPNGAEGRYTRISSGTGLGVVAVPYANFRGLPYLGLVRQYRYPTGEFTLEFPRGGSDDLSLAEAARELIEETGLEFTHGRKLGTIRPDTGILTTEVAAWCTFHALKDLENLHVEDETGATVRWYSVGEVMGLVLNGKLTCGISLAALALIQNSGIIHEV
ncbi:NUDIX hydrolase [Arthrobacter caoxuetaonis]|uniref:NUDIX hydrolase n=1 Tax=Arthrobacter caoxuetaonis TaxID=2886935 RepID=A0A9X1SE93_9MICC|nr:NUDIX hydrolase [Arthrobacter caoxuetaonis]MCC3299426.1 NUDIX hydrolase [Arthrobacter caoxuetaonis]USQ59081.1 NUDIX hydrolase [Arthrobacter caoxuetaonis]